MRVLDADPELLEDFGDDRAAEAARQHVVARAETVRVGCWNPSEQLEEPGGPFLGLLVIDGLLCHRVTVGSQTSVELLGAGDVLRPWDGDLLATESADAWEVLSHLQLAWLDREFALMIARWPRLIASLMRRQNQRTAALSHQLTISHLTGVEARVLLALEHIGQRWGKVTPDGVVVPLRLTNEMLGNIIGARRPSVSAALARLAHDGLVERCHDSSWLLRWRDDARGEAPVAGARG